MTYLNPDLETVLRDRHPIDTEIWLIAYEGLLADVFEPGTSEVLFSNVSGALQGDALLADMMQAEGGQESVVPEWFTKGVEALAKKGYKGDDVIPYLKKLMTEAKRISAEARANAPTP